MNKPYYIEIVVFLTGAVLMTYELAASRVLAPYVGTSLPVWTSIIGVILGSLSLGYWLGGKFADKNPQNTTLAKVLLITSIIMLISALIGPELLEFSTYIKADVRIKSLITSILLFAPASILIGFVTPYSFRLKLKSIDKSGKTAGQLYAIATLGSILGTFLSGFFLIPALGSSKILILLSLTMLVLSALIGFKTINRILFLTVLLLIMILFFIPLTNRGLILNKETLYNNAIVFDRIDQNSDRIVRHLGLNGGKRSSVAYVDNNDLAAEYYEYYDLLTLSTNNPELVLMIGGGTFSYPKYYLERFPKGKIDVVEIDPELTKIAKDYFNFKENQRLKIYNEDGRTYINNRKGNYDAILLDVFSAGTMPFQMTTKEALHSVSQNLKQNGIVVTNIISSFEGKHNKILNSIYWTYKKVFPSVYIFQVYPDSNPDYSQNIIIVAFKTERNISNLDVEPRIKKLIDNLYKKIPPNNSLVFTDDYAPIESYIF